MVHQIVARMRFPGPNYYEVLRWVHEELKPETYLEIGVYRGRSLSLAVPPTIALGIDPLPRVDHQWQTPTQILAMTSTEFFSQRSLAEFFPANRFSLAFIDGFHRFEQAIEDILNLESFAQPGSVIAVHDTIPLDDKTADRTRRTDFHTGDVWKVVPFLKEFRPNLKMITVRTGPSGLTLMRGLDSSRGKSRLNTEAVVRFRELPWEYYKQHRDEFLETIPNERDALARWLSNCGCRPA
jgi:hypothetical protein